MTTFLNHNIASTIILPYNKSCSLPSASDKYIQQITESNLRNRSKLQRISSKIVLGHGKQDCKPDVSGSEILKRNRIIFLFRRDREYFRSVLPPLHLDLQFHPHPVAGGVLRSPLFSFFRSIIWSRCNIFPYGSLEHSFPLDLPSVFNWLSARDRCLRLEMKNAR